MLAALTVPAGASAQRAAAPPTVPVIELRPGLVITSSVRVLRKIYRLSAPASLDSAVITVRGEDITVDFDGAALEGIAPGAVPEDARGVAIRIDGGRNVSIRSARVRGYKVAVLARGTARLSLVGNDLSYNWKPRLFSLIEHESLADWLSYHRNERDEWLRFGAAAYLVDVRGGEIRGNRAEQGMNGILLVRSDSLRIWNNVLSFNSGLGIGLYRSSDNTIMHNRADFNVRGFSHRFYRRGQDSAALLLFEQSSRNVVAYNSMTHSGDGLFLWAGQSTMDTGAGGSNDNVFAANDFSFAPTNGMEATFSRNAFIANRIEGSDHGLWGGYSYASLIAGNDFVRNRIGIAIEHGQDDVISANRFTGDTTGIRLWADPIEPSDWGYPKHRDTRGRDYQLTGNVFAGNRVGIRASGTRAVTIAGNRFSRVDSALVLRDTVEYSIAPGDTVPAPRPAGRPALPPDARRLLPPRLPGGLDPASELARSPRSSIIVTDWGPYDWRSPLLWPADSSSSAPLALRVIGPAGSWRVAARRGIAAVSRDRGRTGDTIVVTPVQGLEGDWELTLEYRGEPTVSPRGTRLAAGKPYRFSYRRFEPAASWTVHFHAWGDSADPRKDSSEASGSARGVPLATRTEPRLDYIWYRPTIAGVPQERFVTEATATVALPPGKYTLRTISDDGVRVWVDGRLVIDDWTPHESAVDAVPIGGGTHDIRVRHFQVGGWTELRLEFVAGTDESRGSPGPH